jgi:hypothetical protein
MRWKACSNEGNECCNLQGRMTKIKFVILWPRKFPLLDGKSCNLRRSFKVCDLQFVFKSYSNEFNVTLKFHLAKSTIKDIEGKFVSSYFFQTTFKNITLLIYICWQNHVEIFQIFLFSLGDTNRAQGHNGKETYHM